jgi:hypothetical protein
VRTNILKWGIQIHLLAASFSALFAASGADPRPYNTGISTILALSRDLYQSLSPSEKAFVPPELISVETSARPSIRPIWQIGRSGRSQTVLATPPILISTGFVDFVNQLAHAEAIDQKRRGYLRRYLESVQRDENHLPSLPDANSPAFWTEDMLNEQQSNFNSIVATIICINLAHLYLGHYQKYAPMLENSSGAPMAINSFLTREEWDESYRWAVRHAMSAGCMIEGVLPFFETLNKIKHRSTWTGFFLPERLDFATMRKDMVKLQERFLKE